jgi:acyl-CoA dehydrogenase
MASDWDASSTHRDLPPHVWQYIKDKGFFGMIIPKQYGGLGFSAYAHSQVITRLSTHCGHDGGDGDGAELARARRASRALRTQEQKELLPSATREGRRDPVLRADQPLTRARTPRRFPTTATCGGASTKASACSALSVTWDKRYITLAPVATLLGLAFRVYDPRQAPRRQGGPRHHVRARSDVASGRAHRTPAHAAQLGVPERARRRARRLHSDGLVIGGQR